MGNFLPTVKEIAMFIFILIALSLVLRGWKGANELFKTGIVGSKDIIKVLES